jgi:transposase
MMGQASNQDQLFYSFNLDDHVPRGHLLRGIDRFLDLGDLRRHLAGFYSHTGRPSIDPELMVRMLVVGYCFGIRSERRLCEEVHLNLAYRWFCRLGLEDKIPYCVFRIIVTDRFGIVTADFGNVTGHFGDVTEAVLPAA